MFEFSLQAGYRHIDTAWEYGVQEEVIFIIFISSHLISSQHAFLILRNMEYICIGINLVSANIFACLSNLSLFSKNM